MNQLLADKRVAYALVVVGIVLVLLALLIDPIRGVHYHIGTVQIIVLIVGIVVGVVGLFLAFVRNPAPPSQA
jgi:hypothetical protein